MRLLAPSLMLLAIIGGWTGLSAALPAQDIRVYTKVTDVSSSAQPPQVIAHSLTLFHGGKVYDYVESVGEVVIYERSHHQFVILNKSYAATRVPFAQVNHFLEAAQKQSVGYLEELRESANTAAAKKAAAVRFQLSPQFHEEYVPEQNRLTLEGGPLDYVVAAARLESPEIIAMYLEYADWAARLNYVLHPQAVFPEPRLHLNRILRSRELLPYRVELRMDLESEVKLRAEHEFSWKLQPIDRQHISMWEKKLESDKVRWLTFHEYQQRLLTEASR